MIRAKQGIGMINIYVIKNLKNGHQYIDYTEKPLNRMWKEMLQKYESENTALYMAMRYYGISNFKISILEEYYNSDIDDRMEYWFNRYNPEYNLDVLEHNVTRERHTKTKRKWGIQRTKKPSHKHDTNTIKCRHVETGKLKTLHGWKAAAEFCNGTVESIKRSIKRDGTAYGYKWWVYKQAKDIRRKVYGVHKEGHITPIFNSIKLAMLAMGGDDRGKGICTSIKWKQRWKGYMWYYAED